MLFTTLVFGCEEVGRVILEICSDNSVHDLMSKCADEGDASCVSAKALRTLAVQFLQLYEALKKKLVALQKQHGEGANALVESVDRARKLYRCLSHLLSAPTVGQPTTAAEVLWFAEYTGKATFEKSFKATIKSKPKAQGNMEDVPKGFWQKMIDECVCKAASSMQLRPTYKRFSR